MPFTGLNPGSNRSIFTPALRGQGITNGVAANLTLSPLIIGEDSRYAPLLEPSRKSLTSRPSLGRFIQGQIGELESLAEYATPDELSSVEDLAPGDGGTLREGLAKIAVYKDEQRAVHRRFASCRHMGCIVHWNSLEKCWDCPCHASHFAPEGSVLNGPAVTALANADS